MSGGKSTDLSRVDVGSNFALSTSGYLHKPLQKLPSLINSVDQSKWRKILKVVAVALVHDDLTEEHMKTFKGDENLQLIFLGLLDISQQTLSFASHLYRQENLKQDLSQMHLPAALIEDLVQFLFVARRDELSSAVVSRTPSIGKLRDVKFRIDIVLSNNRMKKVLQPRVILSLLLDDNSVQQIELDNESLQMLRFKSAMCLKELHLLKLTPVMANQ